MTKYICTHEDGRVDFEEEVDTLKNIRDMLFCDNEQLKAEIKKLKKENQRLRNIIDMNGHK
jgi:dynactin complex subunit